MWKIRLLKAYYTERTNIRSPEPLSLKPLMHLNTRHAFGPSLPETLPQAFNLHLFRGEAPQIECSTQNLELIQGSPAYAPDVSTSRGQQPFSLRRPLIVTTKT